MSKTLCFIGSGNIANALIGGLRDQVPGLAIRSADPCRQARLRIRDAYSVETFENNAEAVREADIVVLSVKPQVIPQVLPELAAAISNDQLILSVAAGTTTEKINTSFGGEQPVVRAMPNTPAMVGMAMTTLYANTHCSPQQRADSAKIMKAVGSVAWIDQESDMDVVTAVSGSGPAYFFYMIEALREAGETAGLPADTANRLAIETAAGAAALARRSGQDISTLREQVTSPGGTTEAALGVLRQLEFKHLMQRAIERAAERSRELSG